MPGIIDIGLALGDLLLRKLSGNENDSDPGSHLANPAPARFVVRVGPPYYELPPLEQKVVLLNPVGGEVTEFLVRITPETHAELFAFVRAGLRHERDGVDAGQLIDTISETKRFQATHTTPAGIEYELTGNVSASAAPTIIS